MNQTFTVTLSRAHKIADRMGSRTGELRVEAEKLGEVVTLSGYTDAQVSRLKDNGQRAVAALAELTQVAIAQAAVRGAIGRANANVGVNEVLATIEANKKILAGIDAVLKSQDESARGGLVRLTEISTFKSLTTGETFGRHLQVSVFEDGQINALAAQKKQIERDNFALSDKLADLNSATVQLSLDSNIADLVGLKA